MVSAEGLLDVSKLENTMLTLQTSTDQQEQS